MRSPEPDKVSVRFLSTATDQDASNIALLSGIQTRPTLPAPSSYWPKEGGIEGISHESPGIHCFQSLTGGSPNRRCQ